MKPLAGSGLLITGSGIYWILSSQLIASFSVLIPEVFRGSTTGTALVLISGIFASIIGLWIINVDLEELSALFLRNNGWMFTIPMLLASLDVSVTCVGLTYGVGIVELNPFVSAAFQSGTLVLAIFAVAYMALSEGIAILAFTAGRLLLGPRPTKYLPFSLVCGIASFSALSNLFLLAGLDAPWSTSSAGAVGVSLFTIWVYRSLSIRPFG